MGWLFMHALEGHASPRACLDAQFTKTTEQATWRILKSVLVRMRTYYAALEVTGPEKNREVFAIVCLVQYNPHDKEGTIFGYKDRDETVGPCEAECPASILDLLTPTNHEYAIDWRERCRAFAARRAACPKLRNGDVIVLDQPLHFTDGSTHQRLITVIDPRGHAASASVRSQATGVTAFHG